MIQVKLVTSPSKAKPNYFSATANSYLGLVRLLSGSYANTLNGITAAAYIGCYWRTAE